MKNLLILFSLQFFLFSCQQKVDEVKAKQLAQAIHDYTSFQYKAPQQAFVDLLTNDIQNLQQDKDTVIDTKLLRELLVKANDANQESLLHIKKTAEVDHEINFRQKTLDCAELFKSLYDDQFSRAIDILESKDTNRGEQLSKLIDEKLQEKINQIQGTANDADADFTTKYNISFPEDSTK